MAKAYDDDELVQRGSLTSSLGISLAEILAAASLIYVCATAAFNAGYFSEIRGNFVQLFTFTDIIGTNIPIIQYFFGVVTVYGLVSILISTLLPSLRTSIKDMAEAFAIKHHYSHALFWT